MPLSSSPSLPPSPPPPSLSFTLYCELKRASLATATALKSEGVPFALPYFAKSWRALASVLSEEVDRGNDNVVDLDVERATSNSTELDASSIVRIESAAARAFWKSPLHVTCCERAKSKYFIWKAKVLKAETEVTALSTSGQARR